MRTPLEKVRTIGIADTVMPTGLPASVILKRFKIGLGLITLNDQSKTLRLEQTINRYVVIC